jgi:hypothetical protein
MITALLLAVAATASAQASLDESFRTAQDAARAASAQPAVVVDQNALGSWFRKIASTDSTEFDAIATVGVLPHPHFDPARMHVPVEGEPAYTRGPLDSPGVYVGAHAEGREVDAGLKWDHRYDSQGRDTGLYGWRLFWRVASPAGNKWSNPAPGSDQDIYLNAGDRFAMTLTVRPDGTARLDVHGEGGASAASAVFPLDGFWNGAQRLPRRFKRVHSIDQFVHDSDGRRKGDEGSPAVPTKSALSGGRWESAALIGARRAPLTGGLAVEWRGPDADAAYRSIFPGAAPDAAGGEDIVIRPPAP